MIKFNVCFPGKYSVIINSSDNRLSYTMPCLSLQLPDLCLYFSPTACLSPPAINAEETLNTLKYAKRARNIQNKPIVSLILSLSLETYLTQNIFSVKSSYLIC
jgi:hypothetical protein